MINEKEMPLERIEPTTRVFFAIYGRCLACLVFQFAQHLLAWQILNLLAWQIMIICWENVEIIHYLQGW